MIYRLSLADDLPRLTVPVRLDVFATRDLPKGRGKRLVSTGVAWQGWNADPVMEHALSRLRGQGSFYWPGAVRALAAARSMMATDDTVHQIKLETISGREIGRLWRQAC
jgi:hypothetical protein